MSSRVAKPAAMRVSVFVSVAIELAQEERANRLALEDRMRYLSRHSAYDKEPGGAACNNSEGSAER